MYVRNLRGADRQITVVVSGRMRLAPTGNPACFHDVSAADKISRNVFVLTFGRPFRVCVCAGSDDGDITTVVSFMVFTIVIIIIFK